MVLKLSTLLTLPAAAFESSVNLDGTKTKALRKCGKNRFESSVNLDGTKTVFVVMGRKNGLRVV